MFRIDSLDVTSVIQCWSTFKFGAEIAPNKVDPEQSIIMAPVASGGPHGVPGMQAGSSPFVAQVRRGLGGENCPMVSHHGYVRARRTSPAWTRSQGVDRVATLETAPTGVERELKSTSGLRLACGRRRSGGWCSLACLACPRWCAAGRTPPWEL